jgi:hypothetical protein
MPKDGLDIRKRINRANTDEEWVEMLRKLPTTQQMNGTSGGDGRRNLRRNFHV